MRARAGLLGLLLVSCADEQAEAPEPTPIEQLDACGLPEPCTAPVYWDGCGNHASWTYEEHDACAFDLLMTDEPAVIRSTWLSSVCGDIQLGDALAVYRWADGSMTCVRTDGTDQYLLVSTCSVPDTAPFASCLAATQAGDPVTEACLSWHMWGLEFGDPVEPECGPLP